MNDMTRMCKILVSKKHYRGCPTTCDIESRDERRCDQFPLQGNKLCEDTKTEYLGLTTHNAQCPNHRDEGYSQR